MNISNLGLRDYQVNLKNEVYSHWENGDRKVMLQMPTGTGKTRIFSSIVWDYLRYFQNENETYISSKILIIAHRRELLSQIAKNLEHYNIKSYGFIDSEPSHRKRADKHYIIHLANNMSLNEHHEQVSKEESIVDFDDNNRLLGNSLVKLKYDDIKLIIVDEAHHALADSYKKVIEKCSNAKILGVTATPCRLNGASFRNLFDRLIVSNNHSFFVKNGFLKPLKFYSYSPFKKYKIDNIQSGVYGDYDEKDLEDKYVYRNDVLADIVSAYKTHVYGKKGIVFCVNINHCQRIVDNYRANNIEAEIIHSKTPKTERNNLVEKFKNGEIKILCNVDIFSEGFDCPDIDFVQIARPTLSLSKYLQMVGRASRFYPGKVGYVLDNAGLYFQFGSHKQDWNWQGWFEGEFQNNNFQFQTGQSSINTFEEFENIDYEEVDELLKEVESDEVPQLDNLDEIDFLGLEFYHFLPEKLEKKYFEMQNWLQFHFEDQGYTESEQTNKELKENPIEALCSLYGNYAIYYHNKFTDYVSIKYKYFTIEKEILDSEQEILAKESIEKADLFKIEIEELEKFLPEDVLKHIKAFRILSELNQDIVDQREENFILSLLDKYPNEMMELDSKWKNQNKEIISLKEKIRFLLKDFNDLKLKLIAIYESCQYNKSIDIQQKKTVEDNFEKSKYTNDEYDDDQVVGRPQVVKNDSNIDLLSEEDYLNEIQPNEIDKSFFTYFIDHEIKNIINFQEGLIWSSTEKKNIAINEIKHKVEVLSNYFSIKDARFFVSFKNLIHFIKVEMRNSSSYRFKSSSSDISKILKKGTLSDYELRNKIIDQIFKDFQTEELSIEVIYSGIKKYIPHFQMKNETSLQTWLRSQNHLYEEKQGKMFKKLK